MSALSIRETICHLPVLMTIALVVRMYVHNGGKLKRTEKAVIRQTTTATSFIISMFIFMIGSNVSRCTSNSWRA